MRATRGAVALVVIALLAVGAGCADPTQEQPGDASPSADGVQDVAPGGLNAVDWPDDSEGAAALFAELPARLGSLRIEVLNESEKESEWYEAVYHDPRQELGELDQSSQVARVSFGVPSVGGPAISRAAQVAGMANWWSGPQAASASTTHRSSPDSAVPRRLPIRPSR